MKITIAYDSRTCVTGKALFDSFKSNPYFNITARVRKNKRIRNTDVFIRWGNSKSWNPDNCIQINNADAVRNASHKLTMMKSLNASDVIFTPPFLNLRGTNTNNLDDFRDIDGYFYVRGENGKVRYSNTTKIGDLYLTKPIDNGKREYRVHVFNGNILGIYEKIPYEAYDAETRTTNLNNVTSKIYKDENCKFSLRDKNNCRCNSLAQRMCIDAVKQLGLISGGVDIIRDKEGNFYINEVNSAPALSTVNIERWTNAIIQYIEEKQNVAH